MIAFTIQSISDSEITRQELADRIHLLYGGITAYLDDNGRLCVGGDAYAQGTARRTIRCNGYEIISEEQT